MMNLCKKTRPFFQAWHLILATDILALLLLFLIAWLIAGSLVRNDVFIYGDHAGHYWTMWYTLNVAAPQHHVLID
jgi:hypothetical protein